MFTIAIAVTVGVVIGVLAGPALRLYATQIVTDVKAEFSKEKAVVEADLATAKADLITYKTATGAELSKLRTDLSAAEAKVAAVASLFPTSPQIQSIVAPPAPAPVTTT